MRSRLPRAPSTLPQSVGLKLYVPSHAQSNPLRYETTMLAWKCVNSPVPPQKVQRPTASEQFPNATFIVTAREWEAATKGPGLRGGYISRQFDHAFDWRTIDFDGDDVSSYKSFGRTLDLFGDGSVRLAHTPGHTLGHMSVVVRTAGPEFLIVGDAAYTMRTIRESAMPYGAHDEHEFRRSLKEVQRYLEQTPDAAICPGHDLEAFRALNPVY